MEVWAVGVIKHHSSSWQALALTHFVMQKSQVHKYADRWLNNIWTDDLNQSSILAYGFAVFEIVSPRYLKEICWLMCCVTCAWVWVYLSSVPGCQGGGSIWVPRQRCVVLAPILRQTTVLLAALRLRDLLGHRLVVMRPKTLALAGGDHADFVRPSVAVGTLQLDPACPGVRRDAAVVWGAASPPLATEDGVRHEVRRQALTRAHQLSDRLGTAARAVGDVTGRTQLPAAHLRGTWVEERR